MLKAERERKTRRVQLALAPSLYAAALKVGARIGKPTFTGCVEAALRAFVSPLRLPTGELTDVKS